MVSSVDIQTIAFAVSESFEINKSADTLLTYTCFTTATDVSINKAALEESIE